MIPPNAKKVFSGVIFDVYQWEQEMYDGSTATFERLKRPDTSEIVTVIGEKILIQKQTQPDSPEAFFSLPGGRIEHGEEPLAGAKRELLEETGYVSEDWEPLGAHTLSGKIDWTLYIYVARDCKRIADQTLDAGERIELIELSFDDFLAYADRGDLYMDPYFTIELVRAKYDAKARERVYKKIFG